jgi:hypothetical protein
MKYTAAGILALTFALGACSNAADKIKPQEDRQTMTQMVSNTEVASFEFDKEFHDFGDIEEGKTVNTTFEFTNTGDVPLVITNASGSCGCTVPDYPRTPIAPGDKGEIKVSFNSTGRPGKNDKSVTIEANTMPRTTVLKITSTVLPKTNS